MSVKIKIKPQDFLPFSGPYSFLDRNKSHDESTVLDSLKYDLARASVTLANYAIVFGLAYGAKELVEYLAR